MAPGSRPWFAYSLDLAPATAARHLHGLPPVPDFTEDVFAEALDVDVVYDVPVPNWGGRIARLVEAPGRRVPGRLRFVSEDDWPALVRLEAALTVASEEHVVQVRTASGDVMEALAFTPGDRDTTTDGPVSEAFLVTLATAAERARLPSSVLTRLQAEARIVQTVQRARPPHKPGIK